MSTFSKALKGVGAYKTYKSINDSIRKANWPYMQTYVLDRLGLERKSTVTTAVLSGVGFFALGMLVGSALGVMFAPASGKELRTTMREQGMKGVMEKTRSAAQAQASPVTNA